MRRQHPDRQKFRVEFYITDSAYEKAKEYAGRLGMGVNDMAKHALIGVLIQKFIIANPAVDGLIPKKEKEKE